MSGLDLLPCPFCGASKAMMFGPTCRPETPYNPADRLFPVVRCMGCYAEVAGDNEDYRGGTAIAAWNRRAALPAPESAAELVERLTARQIVSLSWPDDALRLIDRLNADRLGAAAALSRFSPGWRSDMENAPASVYAAVERALDESSAWISRPSKAVTQRVALAAAAAYHVLAQKAAGEALDIAEAEIERVRPTVCDTFTVLDDGPFTRREGRISEDGLNKLHEAVLTLAAAPAAPKENGR